MYGLFTMACGSGEPVVMVRGWVGVGFEPPPPHAAKKPTINNKPESTRTLDNLIASPLNVEG